LPVREITLKACTPVILKQFILPGLGIEPKPVSGSACIVPMSHGDKASSVVFSSYGDRCFAAAGLKLWNSLPAHPRQTHINFEQFKWLLTRHLCSGVETAAHCG